MMYEEEVRRMEREEEELINRLKATKSLEEQLERDLEMQRKDPNFQFSKPVNPNSTSRSFRSAQKSSKKD